MVNEEFYDDELFIYLTIDGTEYEDVEVKVTKPNKTIREQIQSIVNVFELPKTDRCGHPIHYLLGQMLEEGEEPEVLEFEDVDGRENSLLDYNIQSGDCLHLMSIAAYACPIPEKMKNEWSQCDLLNH